MSVHVGQKAENEIRRKHTKLENCYDIDFTYCIANGRDSEARV